MKVHREASTIHMHTSAAQADLLPNAPKISRTLVKSHTSKKPAEQYWA